MSPNVIKDLQNKVAVLERNNKTLTERLGRAEHKVGVLLQWALSFPGLAASQGLTQLKTTTTQSRPKSKPANQPERRKSNPRSKAATPKVQAKEKILKEKDRLQQPSLQSSVFDVTNPKDPIIPEQPIDVQVHNEYSMVEEMVPQSMETHELHMEGIHHQDTVELDKQVVQSETFVVINNTMLPLPIVEIQASALEVSQTEVQSGSFEQMEEGGGESLVLQHQEEEEIVEKADKIVHIPHAKFICTICGSGYAYAQGLNRHMNTVHHQLQEFPCKLCGKIFYRNDKHRSHELQCAKKANI